MSKRISTLSMQKVEKYIKEGRGQGEFDTYRPWLTVQSFPAMGRVSRIKGSKTNRIHHFLSDLELHYFYILEWNTEVIDIREHFPLLDLGTLINKDDLQLSKRSAKLFELPYVLTTNFLITNKSNEYIARSVKYESALDKQGVKEKLQIQHLYWAKKGIDFKVITEKQLNIILAKNIESLHPFFFDNPLPLQNIADYPSRAEEFLNLLSVNNESIIYTAKFFESGHQLSPGTGISLFKYLVAKRKITVNMDKPLDYSRSLQELMR